jgi:hypothetical protein
LPQVVGEYGNEAEVVELTDVEAGVVVMKSKKSVSMRLMAVGILYTLAGAAPSYATNVCEADLARVDPNFCLSADHMGSESAAAKTPLTYTWNVTDTAYGLKVKNCIPMNGLPGQREDIVIALDRSSSMYEGDNPDKTGSRGIGFARWMIDLVKAENLQSPEKASRISVLIFSSKGGCHEAGVDGRITFDDGIVPCMFVPAGNPADSAHYTRLANFLTEAQAVGYSQVNGRGADYGIVAQALTDNVIRMATNKKSGVVLVSDGRTFSGDAQDTWAFLRNANYVNAQTAAVQL